MPTELGRGQEFDTLKVLKVASCMYTRLKTRLHHVVRLEMLAQSTCGRNISFS